MKMKNIFRKNQVIITALAIMIAVAGYLNFTQNSVEKDNKQNIVADGTGTESVPTTADNQAGTLGVTDNAVDGRADDVAATDDETTVVDENGDVVEEEKVDDTADISDEDIIRELGELNVTDTGEVAANSDATEENPGEAVLVNNTISSSFFSSAKLTREQTRAKNKEMLMELIENTNITETQKQDAIQSVINLTSIAEKESATEILLEAKGFEGAVVSIIDETVDVVVNASNITNQQIAQIEDIVKRKTGAASNAIVITPVDASK